MTGYHTRWVRLPEQAEEPKRIVIREALPSVRPCMPSAVPWA